MVSSASPERTGLKPIVLLGAGEHGRVVLDVCRAAGLAVAGFLDEGKARGTMVDGAAVLGGDALIANIAFAAAHDFLPGVGDQALKRRLCQAVLAAGGALASAIHPSAVVSPRTVLGAGTVVAAGTVINTGARIGRFCIINTHASIDHDCRLGDGVQIGPGAILCGTVQCGEDAMVGAGAVLLPGRRLGDRAVAGAGAVVTRDVADGVTAYGNPARPAVA